MDDTRNSRDQKECFENIGLRKRYLMVRNLCKLGIPYAYPQLTYMKCRYEYGFRKIGQIVLLILCLTILGCASLSLKDEQTERKTIDIYDNQGNVKEHVIIKDNHLIIYDKDWNTKGYGKIKE